MLQKFLCTNGGAISVDMWIDDYRRIPYIGITCQFLEEKENELVLHDRVLCVRAVSVDETKTGEFIFAEVVKVMMEFSLLEAFNAGKIVVITDRGKNIINAFKNKNDRINCFIHLINNIVQSCCKLSSVVSILSPVRSTVRYMKVTGLNNKLNESLKSYVRTRFNTNIDMLNSVYRNWDELNKILEEKNEMKQLQKQKNQNQSTQSENIIKPRQRANIIKPKKRVNTNRLERPAKNNKTPQSSQSISFEIPEYVEKEEIKILIDFLGIFKEASDSIEKTKSPTLYLVWIWVIRIKEHLKENRNDHRVIKMMKKVSSKYLDDNFVFHDYYKVSVFLHPLFKGLHKFCETEQEKEEIYSIVRNMIRIEETDNEIISSNDTRVRNALSFDSFIDSHSTFSNTNVNSLIDVELNSYKLVMVQKENFNLLNWWYQHRNVFPNLFKVVKFIHSIPATSASAERSFSLASNHITEKRCNLNPDTADALVFLNNNFDFFEKTLCN